MTVSPILLGGNAFDSNYVRPLNFKVIIKSNDGLQTFATYNGFNPPTFNTPPEEGQIAVTAVDVKRGIEQTGSFDIIISDANRTLNRDKVDCGNIVIIQAGKTEASLRNVMYGICYNFDGQRVKDDLTWHMSGKGSAAILQHTLINFTRSAPTETLGSGSQVFKKDPNFMAHVLFKEIFEATDVLVSKRSPTDTLKMRGNFSLDSISTSVTEIIPTLKFPVTAASSVLNAIAEATGALWLIDENNDVNFFYPETRSSSIVIKDLVEATDDGDFTAYTLDDVGFTSSIDPGEGFANVLYGVSELSSIVAGENSSVGFEELVGKDLGSMVIPGLNLFKDLTFTLSKTGAGTDATNPAVAKVRGYIVKDKAPEGDPNEVSHSPSGELIATFSIPIKDITETPAPISKIDLKLIPGIRIEPDAYFWIVLQEIGDSPDNTVRWHHDNDFETETNFNERRIRWAAVRYLPMGRSAGDSYSYRPWISRSKGPNFSYAFIASSKILSQARDPLSIARWTKGHPVEARMDEGWITNAVTMGQFLNQVVHASAQLPVSIGTIQTTIPNALYNPGSSIQFADTALGFPESRNFTMQCIEDHYWADASDFGQGNLLCEVALKGFVSPIDFLSDSSDPDF